MHREFLGGAAQPEVPRPHTRPRAHWLGQIGVTERVEQGRAPRPVPGERIAGDFIGRFLPGARRRLPLFVARHPPLDDATETAGVFEQATNVEARAVLDRRGQVALARRGERADCRGDNVEVRLRREHARA
jgi:hypothetical protein